MEKYENLIFVRSSFCKRFAMFFSDLVFLYLGCTASDARLRFVCEYSIICVANLQNSIWPGYSKF